MRAFAAVFAREVFARRLVFPVALAAGFVPLVGSLAYGWSKPDAAEGRILVALVAAASFSLAFALLFGGSVVAGETSEKRISFFFSRPLPAGAIWGGKLLAVLFLTLVPGSLVLAPALLSAPSARPRGLFGLEALAWQDALATVVVAFFFVLGAHAVVTIARLRSPWVVLDLLLAPGLVLLAAAFVFSLVRDRAFTAFQNGGFANVLPLFAGLVAVSLAALAAASYTQVAVGRTDTRRAHGAFSVVLWGILGTATAGLGGFAWWAASAQATDLVSVEGGVLSAPRGPWAAAGGPLGRGRGYGMFLFDAGGGGSLRLRSDNATFSADGARAAWGERSFGFLERDRKSALFVADLASARTIETGIECGPWSRVALSPSGRRLAVLDGNALAAYDVTRPDKPQQLAAFRLEGEARQAVFVDEDVIRLFPRFHNAVRKDITPAGLEITELSLLSKKPSVTGRFERETLPFLRMSADGRLFVGVLEKRLTLHDGRTGALLSTLTEELRSPQVRFLSGGRVAVAGIAGAQAEMKIFLEGEEGRSATAARTTGLGPAKRLVLGGEIAAGRVAVSLFPFEENLPGSGRAAKLAIVDATTGAIFPGPDGLVLADRLSWWISPILPPAEAGSPASRLFLTASGALVRLDPATGARTVVLGRSK